ncbi:MAG: delta-class carbonic anhydrase [Gammaproteobacteria bacterium]|nr:delta-class carbonic anhydrase [Gammaproteobacteria bacterium]
MNYATLGSLSISIVLAIYTVNCNAAENHPSPGHAEPNTHQTAVTHTVEAPEKKHRNTGPACEGFGPQTPRDIDIRAGLNPAVFPVAPPREKLNLCNIHFHESAEHRAAAFSIYAGDGHDGYGSGYQCGISKQLSKEELRSPLQAICNGAHGDLQPGDTIEVHWVHTSCDVKPGPTLGACVTDTCSNPSLRVETQVFTLVNDHKALDFLDLTYGGFKRRGLHQAKNIPSNTGRPVEFLGSTTGPKYSEQSCSPYQVTWSVRPECAKLDINSVGEWCKGNVFKEDHAHGVRELVTNPKLLSTIH